MSSRAQIIATIGPASEQPGILAAMLAGQMDVVRLNFAWLEQESGARVIEQVRSAARAAGRTIPLIADLPGPRVQLAEGHTYDAAAPFAITEHDEAIIKLCAGAQVEYLALSFVGSAGDVALCRDAITKYGGTQRIIAKIERKAAVDAIESIIAAADAIMIARGDLGNEIPLEEIPFVQKMIVEKAHAAGKPVIVATQMMLSMTEHAEPTRAEVTDVAEASVEGADAVMLSEETASGRFPAEAVAMMERVLIAAEAHGAPRTLHPL